MSWKITNYCPSDLQSKFNAIPEGTTILNLDEIWLNYGMSFPLLPSSIKEVNINENIYVINRNRERLIKPEMTKQQLKGLLQILFPNWEGKKFSVSMDLYQQRTPYADIANILNDIDAEFN
jgi:hypothetical protein